MRNTHGRGEGRVGCVIWLIILGFVILVLWQAVPVKIKSADMADYMDELATNAGRKSPEDLIRRIVQRAKQLDLPVEKKNVSAERLGGRVRLRCTYTVPLDFVFYTYNWDFEHLVDRAVFLM